MNKWFKEVFLPNVTKTMENNKKYPYTMILSDKQADICYKYMEAKECKGDYGWFTNYYVESDGKKYMMYTQGRYTFLRFSFLPVKTYNIENDETEELILSTTNKEEYEKWLKENVVKDIEYGCKLCKDGTEIYCFEGYEKVNKS